MITFICHMSCDLLLHWLKSNNRKAFAGAGSSSSSSTVGDEDDPKQQQQVQLQQQGSAVNQRSRQQRAIAAVGECALLGQARGLLSDMLALVMENAVSSSLRNADPATTPPNINANTCSSIMERVTAGLMALNDLLEPIFVAREKSVHSSRSYHDTANAEQRSLSSISCNNTAAAASNMNSGYVKLSHRLSPALRPDHFRVAVCAATCGGAGGTRATSIIPRLDYSYGGTGADESDSSYHEDYPPYGSNNAHDGSFYGQDLGPGGGGSSSSPLPIPGDRPFDYYDTNEARPFGGSPALHPPPLLVPKKSVVRKSLPPALARRVSSAGGLWSTTTSATGMPTLEPTTAGTFLRSHKSQVIAAASTSPCSSAGSLTTPNNALPPVDPRANDKKSSKGDVCGKSATWSTLNGSLPCRFVAEEKDDDSGISTDTPSATTARRIIPLGGGGAAAAAALNSQATAAHNGKAPYARKAELFSTAQRSLIDVRDRVDHTSSSSPPPPPGMSYAGQCISSQSKSSPTHAQQPQQHQPQQQSRQHQNSPTADRPQPARRLMTHDSVCNDSGTETGIDRLPNESTVGQFPKTRPVGKVRGVNEDDKTSGGSDRVIRVYDGTTYDLDAMEKDPILSHINSWQFPIFDFAARAGHTILSQIAYRIFYESNLFTTFDIPVQTFLNFFHALEDGYRDNPYHNRIHAADVLQAVYYLTTQPVPGFKEVSLFGAESDASSSSSPSTNHNNNYHQDTQRPKLPRPSPGSSPQNDEAANPKLPPGSAVPKGNDEAAAAAAEEGEYGITGHNLAPLELMALYTAAAMHDYDHPGRTNAFLVTISSPQAILYNDRSVLENHHAAASWKLYLSNVNFQFLSHLPTSEFKRFRFLVIEAILATDLKRHFEILAEFNAKISEEAGGVDWFNESDRLLVLQMCIKIADINGPCKPECLHLEWTKRITEEFYLQGDEETQLGLEISPYMDKRFPQVSKLQESFITHLVAPLSNSFAAAGMLPGYWEYVLEEIAVALFTNETLEIEDKSKDSKAIAAIKTSSPPLKETLERSEQTNTTTTGRKKCACSPLTTFLRQNHLYWNAVIKAEDAERNSRLSPKKKISSRSLPPEDKISGARASATLVPAIPNNSSKET